MVQNNAAHRFHAKPGFSLSTLQSDPAMETMVSRLSTSAPTHAWNAILRYGHPPMTEGWFTTSGIVDGIPVVDVHEHHLPGVVDSRDVGLLDILRQSYADWTRARPYRLPGEPAPIAYDRGGDPALLVHDYLSRSGSSAFVRNMIAALTDLYELPIISESDCFELDARIREAHRDPQWPDRVLDRAGVNKIVTDPYNEPLLDATGQLGDRYMTALRINPFVYGWSPTSTDHSGNCAHDIAQAIGVEVASFPQYCEFIEYLFESRESRGNVILKNALAYDRDVAFDPEPVEEAAKIWGKGNPSELEIRTFTNWTVDHFCVLAAKYDIPMQIHLGMAIIPGSRPEHIIPLIARHPRTRFLLMHLAYPWSRELLGIAFTYRNVSLDISWAPLLSPSHFELALHEALEVLPSEGCLMIGGDNWHVEETYGAIMLTKSILDKVLREKVKIGYLRTHDAERIARKVCYENASKYLDICV